MTILNTRENYTGYATFVIEIYGCNILWSSLIDIT